MENKRIIQVDEKVPFKMLVPLSIQHMFAMFGASVLVPFVFGINPAVVLFMNGLGTLLFILITKGRAPAYLGSSFAFLAPAGIVISKWLTEFRISRGKEQLTLTDLSVEEIAVSCGYRNSLAFGKVFKQKIGMTPTQYRNDNRKVARERLISVQNELKEYKKHKKIYVGEGEKE